MLLRSLLSLPPKMNMVICVKSYGHQIGAYLPLRIYSTVQGWTGVCPGFGSKILNSGFRAGFVFGSGFLKILRAEIQVLKFFVRFADRIPGFILKFSGIRNPARAHPWYSPTFLSFFSKSVGVPFCFFRGAKIVQKRVRDTKKTSRNL